MALLRQRTVCKRHNRHQPSMDITGSEQREGKETYSAREQYAWAKLTGAYEMRASHEAQQTGLLIDH